MRRVLKSIGLILGGLLALLVLAFVVLSVLGSARVNRVYDIAAEPVTVPTDADAIARGRHLAEAVTICQACHGENLEGSVIDEEAGIVTISAPNLTSGRGGVGGDLTDADFVRAIRHGVDPEGHGLMIMHSDYYHNLGADDLGALIAYVKSAPPVDSELPETAPGPIGRALLPLGVFDEMPIALFPVEVIDHSAPFVEPPPEGATAAYGGYLVSIALCQMCHGPDLTGGPPLDPASPAGPNISRHAAAGGWSQDDFVTTIRTGVTPSGRTISAEAMPWEHFSNMTDEELVAIWLYLGSLNGN